MQEISQEGAVVRENLSNLKSASVQTTVPSVLLEGSRDSQMGVPSVLPVGSATTPQNATVLPNPSIATQQVSKVPVAGNQSFMQQLMFSSTKRIGSSLSVPTTAVRKRASTFGTKARSQNPGIRLTGIKMY